MTNVGAEVICETARSAAAVIAVVCAPLLFEAFPSLASAAVPVSEIAPPVPALAMSVATELVAGRIAGIVQVAVVAVVEQVSGGETETIVPPVRVSERESPAVLASGPVFATVIV